ncbi:MAG: HDIG domain-containing protein [Magnetococcales bacterium]|nr:HDIG domain-containing protein [Magnetococcales bacterium]
MVQMGINWENIPRINIEGFDEDHKKIIEIINILLRSRSGTVTDREFRSAVSKLMIYVSSHFKREEKFLEDNKYPDITRHKEEHFHIIRKILSIKKSIIEDNYRQNITPEMVGFLTGTIVDEHFSKSDVEFAKIYGEELDDEVDGFAGTAPSDEVKENLAAQLQALDDFPDDDFADSDRSKALEIEQNDFAEEISVASDTKHQAQQSVKSLLHDISAGIPVKHEKIADSSALLHDSFKRNTSALLALSLLEDNDDSVVVHSVNVATYLIAFCKIMGFDDQTTVNVAMGGMLHDVGKCRGDSESLDPESKHVLDGLEILEIIPGFPKEAIIIAAQHHERVDGSGFPNKLLGSEIHVLGQMAGIANLFDTLTSQRANQDMMPPNVALRELLGKGGGEFDGELIQKFIKAVGIHPVGTTVELKDGSVAIVAKNDPDSLLQPVINIVYDKSGKKQEDLYQIDLKKEKAESQFQIKGAIKVKHKSFDPMDALLALRANA